ncbi:MAG: hypothetical protein CM15mP128_4470 [Methanobacteriota archaeon]|nr:MAG: hypothetical protein CM15mP128_4470 [Euryarchaeota archaeon]
MATTLAEGLALASRFRAVAPWSAVHLAGPVVAVGVGLSAGVGLVPGCSPCRSSRQRDHASCRFLVAWWRRRLGAIASSCFVDDFEGKVRRARTCSTR